MRMRIGLMKNQTVLKNLGRARSPNSEDVTCYLKISSIKPVQS